jgi:hypothetical protein
MSWRSDSLWIEWQGDTKARIELWNRGAIQAKDSIAGRVLSGRWEIRDSNLRFEPWQQSRPPRGETTSEIGQTWECRVQFPDRWSLALCCEDFCQSPSQALRFTRSTRSGCPR